MGELIILGAIGFLFGGLSGSAIAIVGYIAFAFLAALFE